MKHLNYIGQLFFISICLSSCGYSEWDELGEIKTPGYFNIDKYLSLAEGEEYSIKIDMDEADYNKIVWSSTDESIATVTRLGRVKAVSKGKAIIIAKLHGKEARCELVVEAYNTSFMIRLHDGTYPGMPYLRVDADEGEVEIAESIMGLRKLFPADEEVEKVSVYVNKNIRMNRVEYHHLGSKYGPMIRANSMETNTQLELDRLIEDTLFLNGFMFVKEEKGVKKEGYLRPLNIKIYRSKKLGLELKAFLDYDYDMDEALVPFATLQFIPY